MEVAINLEIIRISNDKVSRWEACFSAMHEDGRIVIAKVERYESITNIILLIIYYQFQ